jgi:hypothetical protein
LLPTVMRKKTLVAFEELKRAHDWCEKLIERQQLAADGVDDNYLACAGEAIGER